MKTQEEEEAEEPSVAAAGVASPSAGTSEQPPSSPMHQRRIESVRATNFTQISQNLKFSRTEFL